MPAWEVELLRLTLFSDQPISITDSDWTAITGQEEAQTRQSVGGGRRYSSPLWGGLLAAGAVGQRVDLVLSHSPNPQAERFALPVIGAWENIRPEFVERTSRWLSVSRFPIIRLAFGAVLLSQTQDRRAAYEELDDLLESVDINPERMRDLIFRINWPVESTKVPGLTINRVSNWTVVEITSLMLQVSGAAVSATTRADESVSALRLEIDYNTDAARKNHFSAGDLVAIYEELVDLAELTADQGEIT